MAAWNRVSMFVAIWS